MIYIYINLSFVLKDFGQFLNESSSDKELRDQYKTVIGSYLLDNGLNNTIMYDTQGYMSIVIKLYFTDKKDFVENIDKTIEKLNVLKDFQSKAMQNFATVNNSIQHIHVTLDFRDLDKVDPFFRSLLGINKYNL